MVGNAIKFTREGEVEVVVTYDPSEVSKLSLKIIDSGIGMTQQQVKKLFRPFTQGNASVNREFGGTGLGLAISRRLAKILGGTILVESEINRGSTFECVIDTGQAAPVELIDADRLVDTGSGSGDQNQAVQLRCHVLVVDDRRDIRYLSRRLLSAAGATVTEVEDGLEAVELIESLFGSKELPDAILLDMQMPRLDGYQTAERLRERGYDGPIIALTADAMQGDMKRCLECGCNDYLSKPINAVELVGKVAAFTSGHR